MIDFDIHVSRNFSGGEYFSSFELDDPAKLEDVLREYWYRAGVTHETAECFLYATVSSQDGQVTLSLGNFVFYADGTLLAKNEMGFNDEEDKKWEMIGYEDIALDEEARFRAQAQYLFDLTSRR